MGWLVEQGGFMAGNAIDRLGWRFYDFWHGEARQMDNRVGVLVGRVGRSDRHVRVQVCPRTAGEKSD